MPELPEVETVARQLEPELEGRRIELLEVLDGRWSRPVAAGAAGRGGRAARTIEGLGRRGKYLLLALDGGRTLVMHLRMTGNLVLVEGEEMLDPSEGRRLYQGERSTSARHLRARFVLDDGREVWFTDPRRFGEAFLIDDADLPERFAKLGRRAALGGVHAGGAGRDGGRPHGAAEVVPARPVAARRGRQHLRRRGALPGPPAPALAGRLDEARAPAGAARRRRRRPGGGDRRRRLLDRRLPRRPRREGDDAGEVPRPHPRGPAVPLLRRRDRPHRRRRPLDLLLPQLPGAAAAQTAAAQASAPPGSADETSTPSGPSVTLVVVPGTTVKTEAIVLRSIRYGEADRILHLYSKTRGRLGAIAKGARKPKSRFGGRLEPFFRLDLVLHEGRGDLLTVTNVATVDGYPRLRSSGPALTAGARACDAVLRLLDSAEPNLPAYNLLCRYLALLDDAARAARRRARGGALLPAQAGAGRPASPRSWPPAPAAARPSTWSASPAPPAASSAPAAKRAPSRSPRRRTRFMVEALAKPLSEAPAAEPPALRQVERAVGETLEHHAHVQLRAALGAERPRRLA